MRDQWMLHIPTSKLTKKLLAQCSNIGNQKLVLQLQSYGKREPERQVRVWIYHHPHTPRLDTKPPEQAQIDITQGQRQTLAFSVAG